MIDRTRWGTASETGAHRNTMEGETSPIHTLVLTMTQALDAKIPKPCAGLPYVTPRLVFIGSVRMLTTSGSDNGKENDGVRKTKP